MESFCVDLSTSHTRGGKVIVINPLKELGLVRFRVPSDWRSLLFGSTISDLYLQPHVGADVALLKAILKGLVESNALDRDYIDAHTNGWDPVDADIETASWDELVRISGVPREHIDRAVEILSGARRGIFMWAMGLTHHLHGVDNILALANVALSRGWVGRPGMGLLPIRGHSNVQDNAGCWPTSMFPDDRASRRRERHSPRQTARSEASTWRCERVCRSGPSNPDGLS